MSSQKLPWNPVMCQYISFIPEFILHITTTALLIVI